MARPGGGIALIVDTTDDNELSGEDFVIEIDGIDSLQASDFVAGTFTVLTGSAAADTNTTLSGPVTNLADTIYGLGGADVLSGADGDDRFLAAPTATPSRAISGRTRSMAGPATTR